MLLACLSWILYGRADALPPYLIGLIAGLASGSAMILYTVIKEANPPQYSGTATGTINLLNFMLTAIMGEIFVNIMQSASQGKPTGLEHYQLTFRPLLYGVGLAVVLTFALKETGRNAESRENVGDRMNPGTGKYERLFRAMRKVGPGSDGCGSSLRENRLGGGPGGRPKATNYTDPRRPGRQDRGCCQVIGYRSARRADRRYAAQPGLGFERGGPGS